MTVSIYTTIMQITIYYDSVYINDCNANNYSQGRVENVGQSPYTPSPVHPAVNGYRILAWGGDLAPASARCAKLPIITIPTIPTV